MQWTPKEVEKLWKLRKKGLTNVAIGKRLKRSTAAVTRMVSKTHDYMS